MTLDNKQFATILQQLIKHESERLKVYDDATGKPLAKGMTLQGNPTIGIGRELSMHGITDEEAAYLCRDDINSVCNQLDHHISWWSSKPFYVKRVLIGMAFNMGIYGLLDFHHMLSAFKQNDYREAIRQMKNSKWFTEVGSRGTDLVNIIKQGANL